MAFNEVRPRNGDFWAHSLLFNGALQLESCENASKD
jgi:hypothetical protein